MKRAVLLLLMLVACSAGEQVADMPGDGPVDFRAIRERVDAAACVQPPSFEIAQSETAWIDVIDRATECQPATEVELPQVDFDEEWAIGAWWTQVPCLGYIVETTSVRVERGTVVVRALTTAPAEGEVCAQAVGVLESILAIDAEGLTGGEPFRFLLDGELVGAGIVER